MAVLIVVLTHNGEATIEATLSTASALEPKSPILVIDNASEDRTVSIVSGMDIPGMTLQTRPTNEGVGKAFNLGLKQAKRVGAKWMMLLDQDSTPRPSMLQKLLEAPAERCGALFPTVRCRSFPDVVHPPMDWTGHGLAPVSLPGGTAPEWITVDTSISSGALYRVDALEVIGGFNEDYFIDFVDHECHLRLREAGYTLWWVPKAEMLHELGRIQRMTESGLWIEHPPYRYYYMARNMMLGYRRFGGLRAVWHLMKEMRAHADRLKRNSDGAAACIAWMKRGAWHGMLGKTGRLDVAH